MNVPILEHDPTREAFIEPGGVNRRRDVAENCVLCFFKETIEKVAREHSARVVAENHWEDGPHPLYEIDFHGQRLAFYHPGIGGSLSAGLLEEVIAFGCRRFMACGGCGVLEKEIAVGHLIVLDSALRDEGTSYHYLPPAREVTANRLAVQALVRLLEKRAIPYQIGKSWTTDAPYRETASKIASRRAEGCLVVEMEAASLMAVAQFRQVPYGQVVYGGDDLSGSSWDNRGWQSRVEVRENLFWYCAEACLSMEGD
jgi:uridine phosphorylase